MLSFQTNQTYHERTPMLCSILDAWVMTHLYVLGVQIGDLFQALGQSMQVGRDEIIRFQVRRRFDAHILSAGAIVGED